MITITNNSRRRIAVPCSPAIFLDAGASKDDVTEAQWAEIKRHRMNLQRLESGLLTVSGESRSQVRAKVRSRAVEDPTFGLNLPEGITGKGVEFDQSGGWYDVYVNGMKATTSRVRKAEAEKIAAEYE